MGQQLMSIEYVTKANHCEAAGRETKIFHHALVLHLKRLRLWYLHNYRRKLSSSVLLSKLCDAPDLFGNTRSSLSIHCSDLENSSVSKVCFNTGSLLRHSLKTLQTMYIYTLEQCQT